MLQIDQAAKVQRQLLKAIFTQVQFHQVHQTTEV